MSLAVVAPAPATPEADPARGTELLDLSFSVTGNSHLYSAYGWSVPEGGYRWTEGTRSVLVLDRPDAPLGFLLEVTWSAFLPVPGMKGQTVSVSAGGRMVAQHEVGKLGTAVFRCPPPERHEERLVIEFDHPQAARPSAVSGHTDDRLLALCFRRLRLIRIEPQAAAPTPAAPPPGVLPAVRAAVIAHGNAEVQEILRTWPRLEQGVRAVSAGGADIVFGQDGNAVSFMAEGWSGLEPGYVWAVGDFASLTLPRLPQADWYVLFIQAQPFTAGSRLPGQSLKLLLNGTKIAEERLSAQFILRVEVPWQILSAAEPAQLVFFYPEAARPRDVAASGDDRVLGFQFKRLLLKPCTEEVAEAAPVSQAVPEAGAEEAAPEMVADAAPALGSEAAAALDEQAPAPPAAAAAEPAWEAVPEPPLNELMKGFESIGQNCEFGLVQRRCGAEPLGLLRFASAPLDKLMPALRRGFAGMGEPGNVRAELSNGEYMILDKVYGFYYHAWVREGEKTAEEIEAREARRVPFLVRKLIEDMRAGEKLFVYHGMEPLDLEEARGLAAALREYGPATLLWVELADETHPAGDVHWIEDGLLKAHVDRFAPGENAHDLSLDSWSALCRRAWHMHQEKAAYGHALADL